MLRAHLEKLIVPAHLSYRSAVLPFDQVFKLRILVGSAESLARQVQWEAPWYLLSRMKRKPSIRFSLLLRRCSVIDRPPMQRVHPFIDRMHRVLSFVRLMHSLHLTGSCMVVEAIQGDGEIDKQANKRSPGHIRIASPIKLALRASSSNLRCLLR